MPTWYIFVKSYHNGKESHQHIQQKVLVLDFNLAYYLLPETFQ